MNTKQTFINGTYTASYATASARTYFGSFGWGIEQLEDRIMSNEDFNFDRTDKNGEPTTTEDNIPDDMEDEDRPSFYHALTELINRYSLENESDTPDWILSEYIEGCLFAFTQATRSRDHWYRIDDDTSAEELEDDCCGQCDPCTKHDNEPTHNTMNTSPGVPVNELHVNEVKPTLIDGIGGLPTFEGLTRFQIDVPPNNESNELFQSKENK